MQLLPLYSKTTHVHVHVYTQCLSGEVTGLFLILNSDNKNDRHDYFKLRMFSCINFI